MNPSHSPLPFYYFYPIFLFLCGAIALYNPKKIRGILGNLRPLRAGILGAVVLLGGITVAIEGRRVHHLNLLYAITACLLIWEASVMWNDIYDQAIDRKTNPKRPLVTGTVSPADYHLGAVLMTCSALSFAAVVNGPVFILVLVCAFLAWAYSAPPLRFRQNLMGYIVIGVSMALSFISGKFAASYEPDFPGLNMWKFLIWVFLYGTAIPIAKDLKDIEGDKAEKVSNLFTALGKSRAKKVFALLFFTVQCATLLIAPQFWLPIIAAAVISTVIYFKTESLAFVYCTAFLSGAFLFFLYFKP